MSKKPDAFAEGVRVGRSIGRAEQHAKNLEDIVNLAEKTADAVDAAKKAGKLAEAEELADLSAFLERLEATLARRTPKSEVTG